MLIKATNTDQAELLQNIISLHTGEIDFDPTYSKGNIYKGLIPPRVKSDLYPQVKDCIAADVRQLPFSNNIFRSVLFDPPFVVGPSYAPGIIRDRFGCFKTVDKLYKFYQESLIELYRVIQPKGYLIFKCQDMVSGGKNHFSHCIIYNQALEIGYIAKDLFIYISKNRLISPNMWKQQHARKFHVFFWVFQKK